MDETPPDKAGTGHERNPLAELPPQELLKHHQRKLRSIALHQGMDGVQAYKARFPEAATLRIHSAPVAYKPKPAGYSTAIVELVSRWFDDADALGSTNRSDVEALNKLLGTAYNPANHFSKPLPASLLRKLAALFAERGAALDIRHVSSLSQVRKTVRSVRAGDRTGAVPMGKWGSRDGDTLIVNGHHFAIERHNGHECIRLSVDGSRLRLRLDALTELLSLTGLAPDSSPQDTAACSIGELAPGPDPSTLSAPIADSLPKTWPHLEQADLSSPGDAPPVRVKDGLAARIDRLATLNSPANEAADRPEGPDPLALI